MKTVQSASIRATPFKLAVKEPHLVSLIILVSFAAFCANLITPALPAISQHFDISPHTTQLLMTTYVVGYAFGVLPYGPLSNRLGRKPTLYIGVILEIFAAVLCLVAAYLHMFWLLTLARLLMALGACVSYMMTFTIIADFYHEHQARVVLSYLMLAFAIMPGLSALLGGALTHCQRLPETHTQLDPNATQWKKIISTYKNLLGQGTLICLSFLFGGSTSIIYIFAASAPFIGINVIGLNPLSYGLWSTLTLLGLATGSVIAGKIANFTSAVALARIALTVNMLAVSTLSVLFMSGVINVWTLFVVPMLTFFCVAWWFPYISVNASAGIADKANASAIMGFINMSSAMISLFIINLIHINLAILMPISFIILSGLMIALFIKSRVLLQKN